MKVLKIKTTVTVFICMGAWLFHLHGWLLYLHELSQKIWIIVYNHVWLLCSQLPVWGQNLKIKIFEQLV